MNETPVAQVIEAALLAAGRPLDLDQLLSLFPDDDRPGRADLREALAELSAAYEGRAAEIVEVASGYRIQVRREFAPWISRLWEERPPRYSRALMETLAVIAYRQPVTRGEIEDTRGVSVGTNIMRTLLDRQWVRAVGHRDVPGRPALYGTTREFLDYFGIKTLDELPTLAELRDLDDINVELELEPPDGPPLTVVARAQKGPGEPAPLATVTDIRSFAGDDGAESDDGEESGEGAEQDDDDAPGTDPNDTDGPEASQESGEPGSETESTPTS